MKALINGKIIKENSIVENEVIVFDKKIVAIMKNDEFNGKYNKEELEIIDAKGNYISPGFIDVHIHGSGGSDTMDGTFEAIETMSKTVAQTGTTSFLPTTMTMGKETIYKALDNIRDAINKLNPSNSGAEILGVHMEGPFINEKYKGAQNKKYILKPNADLIQDYLDIVKIISMAPEEDENHTFIKKMKESNVLVSVGHTNATFEQTLEAIKDGLGHATHTFNAMTPLNHRKPGVVGAVLSSGISAELITDGIHIHPGLFQFFIDTKGKDKVILITDSMRAGNMPDGEYDLGGQNVFVKGDSARLADGTLAGSILTLNTAIKNVYKNTNLELHDVVKLASLNPARIIGVENKKGSLVEGKDSDIVIFDENFEIKNTFVNGNLVYTK